MSNSQTSPDSSARKIFSSDRLRRVGQSFKFACKDFFVDNGPDWAAAVAFYGMLSVFPLLLVTVSVAAQFVDEQWAVQQITRWLGDFVPAVEEDLGEIVREAQEAGAAAGILSMLLLLWSGSYVFGAITTALNVAYDVDEVYGFWKRMLARMTMLFTVGIVLLVAIMAPLLIDLIGPALDVVPAERGTLFNVAAVVLPPAMLIAAFFLVYRFVPRSRPKWTAALTGALVATLLFLLARPLFIAYLTTFGEFNLIYGFLGLAIILLFWAWIVAVILLFGGEVSAHFQALVIEGKSVDAVVERHLARSPDHKDAPANKQDNRS